MALIRAETNDSVEPVLGHAHSPVVPAKAAEPGPIRRSRPRGHGLWVPAFQGRHRISEKTLRKQ
jgi:hypothetical protein